MPARFYQLTIKKITIILLANFTVLAIFSSPSFAAEIQLENGQNLSLFGIAVHHEKRNDIYIGALFAPSNIEKSKQLLDTNIGKRMSLRFMSKYSNRKMTRLWKQRIAMNNSKENWQPYTKEIVQFSNIFMRSMIAGDELNIDYIPKIGTSVYLNGTLFLTIEKLKFYDVLLKVWIGNLPPSESFKKGINGKNKDSEIAELVQKYDNLQAELGRFDEDKIKLTAKEKQPSKKTVKKSTTKKPVKKPVAVKTNKNKSVTETESLVKELQDKVRVSTTTTKKIKPNINTNDILAANLASSSQTLGKDNEALKLAGTASLDSEPNNKPLPTSVKSTANKTEGVLDADLLLGSYTQNITRKIRKHQSYPQKAIIAGEEGFLIVQIKINKKGELISNKVIQRARARNLNIGVLRIIRKAAPFPAIPDELGLEIVEIDIPMTFSLAD